ncbi:glutaredoxin family protein [Candidatus Saccharibacteria bacterium]|nr:glutaredoxin family protein [Candidatus Saccharibacteria bacterium]MBR6122810.1 glutaredoxin family protein [Candidatus Saccharibacteria bacterium]
MIKVFTTNSCVYCHALLDWLDDQNIKYEEIDAVTSEEALERGISSVPVTIITGADGQETKIVGFDRPALKKALKTLAA